MSLDVKALATYLAEQEMKRDYPTYNQELERVTHLIEERAKEILDKITTWPENL